jgi:hypothetical protein
MCTARVADGASIIDSFKQMSINPSELATHAAFFRDATKSQFAASQNVHAIKSDSITQKQRFHVAVSSSSSCMLQ